MPPAWSKLKGMQITCQLTSVTRLTLLVRMRTLFTVLAAILLCGCFGKHHAPQNAAASKTGTFDETGINGNGKLIVTPGHALVGKVALVNPAARFVVINFPVGRLPANEQHLSLYRSGLKVGEVKITGPQYDDNVVADLVAGDSEVGDQVRDK